MSIPALGGGANQALQRALMDAAERAVADELGILDGETPAADTAGAATPPASRPVRRRAAGNPSDAGGQPSDEAIVVELGESGQADRLEVAGGWITAARRGPLETKDPGEAKRFSGEDVRTGEEDPSATRTGGATPAGVPVAGVAAGRTQALPGHAAQGDQSEQVGGRVGGQAGGQVGEELTALVEESLAGEAAAADAPAQPGAPLGAPLGRPGQSGGTVATPPATAAATDPASDPAVVDITLDRLIVVLKKTGIGFRDAYQVLREIQVGERLPPRAELRARWAAADPTAWEDRARERAQAAGTQQSRPADADLRQTPVDDLIRDRAWHRANAAADSADAAAHDPATQTRAAGPVAADRDERADGPTLQTITRQDPGNQAYVAGLSTAEFQRLVTVLGRSAPDWFWDLRGHSGLRGLAERPMIARLNTTRIAGTRLGAWILAMLGMAMLWYIGLHTNVWW
ncbi:hypothetical protein P5P86_00825 [Nocardioides sp. BP30]|uniref:hypothetical protein n=1 Tax=Nocardioides sp. BP30 TaxID=3036374 RepID=UPI00246972AA|nr:hypothetical protein [Nocardioides sp. BP30]WGL52386.1 hypothetical protein P5P86_00825 [Nocardioides sp. BP30]